jgi:hypothetical protein
MAKFSVDSRRGKGWGNMANELIKTEIGTFQVTENTVREMKKVTRCAACYEDIEKGELARVRKIKGYGKMITHAEADICKLNFKITEVTKA